MLLVNRKTGQIIRDLGQGAYADFSPDGKRIVYQKYEGEEPKGIWIMDLESGEEREIIPPEKASRPSWSPEGGRILICGQIYDTLGNPLYDSVYALYAPDWSPPQLNSIVGIRNNQIQVLQLDSMKVDTLAWQGPLGIIKWKYSPNGDWFLFEQGGCIWLLKRDLTEERCYGP